MRSISRRLSPTAAILAVVAGLSVGSPLRGQDDLFVTEVMASNRSTLADENGDYPDWFELFNAGATPIDLNGYFATDRASDLRRWQFPAVTLGAGRFLIVFCSEKDRRTPGGELHTNFRLNAGGGLLAIITPDGQSVAAGFAPSYPPQIEDVSFGLSSGASFVPVIDDGATARVHVPLNGALGLGWTARTFNDASWRAGPTGIGIERSSGFEDYIGTDVESDMHGVNSSIYVRIRFNVSDPSAVDALALRMRYDDGFRAYINGVEVATANAPTTAPAWDDRATTSHADSVAVTLIEFDATAGRAALVAGENVLAIHGLNFSPTSSDFLIDPRLELISIGALDPAATRYFDDTTPGAPNRAGYTALSGDATFSRASGAYTSTFSLSLSAAAGAEIRYTTDGSAPDRSSTRYTSPISISTSTVVNTRVYEPNKAAGRIVSASYFILHSSTASFSSNLPIVIVDTQGRGVGDSVHANVLLQTVELGAGGRARMTDAADFAGKGGLKQRGSSSSGFPKKQWSLEVWDEYNQDRDESLLGMAPESDWILYAPYSDKSLMRNVLSYDWANQMGMWASETRLVELFYKTSSGGTVSSSHYHGVYVLMEKIKRAPDRLELSRLTPSDNTAPEVTGGYIFKKDRLDPGDSGFTTSRGQTLGFVEPKEREISSAQRTYLTNQVNTFESRLYSGSFRDPVNGYAPFIDAQSFVDHHILVELTKNIDGYRLSTFYYKDRNGPIVSGPPWDYNLSLGNANYLEGWVPQGWYYPQLGADAYPFWPRLFQDPDFAQLYIDTWQRLRDDEFATAKLLAQIDGITSDLREAQARNFDRWQILGSYVWPNQYIADTHADEINFMKDWLTQRLAWIDSNYIARPTFSAPAGGFTPDLSVRIAAPVGQIYYTTDGSDPRLPGGSVNPRAISYGESEQDELVSDAVSAEVRALVPSSDIGTAWLQPTFNDAAWSRSTSGVGVGYERGSGYEPYIDLDVESMYDTNTSVYVRIRFTLTDAAAIDFLTLLMRYDDGFVAWLNGTRVASANAPLATAWNSEATAQHDDGAAIVQETFDLTSSRAALRDGVNVLAIQGLNLGITSSDLLAEATLIGGSSSGGSALILGERTTLRARSTTGASRWSGLAEATYVPFSDLPLRVSEIHYHPAELPEGSPYVAADLEFLEILNTRQAGPPVSLAGVRFTNGVGFEFSRGAVPTLAAGERVVIVRDLDAFRWFYDTTGMLIAGEYTGALDNEGDRLELLDGADHLIQDFRFEDEWHPTTDGGGPSLEIVDAGAARARWNEASQWRPSAENDGTPGRGSGDVLPDRGWQLPGDINADGVLDVSDPVALLRSLFSAIVIAPPCDGPLDAEANVTVLDSDGNGSLGVGDAVRVLDHLFRGGPAPVLGAECVRVTGCGDVCVP